jgi:SAM-dependent methyltransferase
LDRAGLLESLRRAGESLDLSAYPDPERKDLSREVERLRRAVPRLFPGGRFLDVGAAEGSFVRALSRAGLEGCGLEPMAPLADWARRKGIAVHAGVFDAEGLPQALRGGKFDLVSFRESIYYMPDLAAAFELARSLLQREGKLYIKSHVADSVYYRRCRDYTRRYGPAAQGLPTAAGLARLVEREGLRVVRWENEEFRYLSLAGLGAGSLPERALNKAARWLLKRAAWAGADRVWLLAERAA